MAQGAQFFTIPLCNIDIALRLCVSLHTLLARDALVEWIVALYCHVPPSVRLFVRPSVCLGRACIWSHGHGAL